MQNSCRLLLRILPRSILQRSLWFRQKQRASLPGKVAISLISHRHRQPPRELTRVINITVPHFKRLFDVWAVGCGLYLLPGPHCGSGDSEACRSNIISTRITVSNTLWYNDNKEFIYISRLSSPAGWRHLDRHSPLHWARSRSWRADTRNLSLHPRILRPGIPQYQV